MPIQIHPVTSGRPTRCLNVICLTNNLPEYPQLVAVTELSQGKKTLTKLKLAPHLPITHDHNNLYVPGSTASGQFHQPSFSHVISPIISHHAHYQTCPITAVKNRQHPGHVYRAVARPASLPRSLCRLVVPCPVWSVYRACRAESRAHDVTTQGRRHTRGQLNCACCVRDAPTPDIPPGSQHAGGGGRAGGLCREKPAAGGQRKQRQ